GGRTAAVHRVSAQRLFPRRVSCPHRARGEHARRRAARHARPEIQSARRPSRMSEPVLRIEGLTVALPAGGDRRYAVENVGLEVAAGEILCLLGESGSGKSIIAQAAMGLLPPNVKPVAGRVFLSGEELLAADARRL